MSLNRKHAVRLAVICSVALNLFFIGALAARYMDRPEGPSEPPSLRWVMRDLDPATRERLRPQTSTFGDHLRPLRVEMFRAQRQVNELLAADTLDQQAVALAFARLRAANLRYQELSHQQLAQLMAELSTEQRTRALRFMLERRTPDGNRARDGNGNSSRDREGDGNHNRDANNNVSAQN